MKYKTILSLSIVSFAASFAFGVYTVYLGFHPLFGLACVVPSMGLVGHGFDRRNKQVESSRVGSTESS